jgi:cell division transport system permease protein
LNWGQALAYFAREASVSLLRSWKVSLLAVTTIAVSLFTGGSFLLLTRNVSRVALEWGNEARVVVYLTGSTASVPADLEELAASAPWVERVEPVDSDAARRRFARTFPNLASLVADWDRESFPPSLEVVLDRSRLDETAFDSWLASLRSHPVTGVVDDDREWLEQLEAIVGFVRAAGLALGLLLLGAAVFTTASVVRLTAYLYLDEIAVMRLVGATEFLIRGPFYTEGVLQGLLGGSAALGALHLTAHFLAPAEGASAWLRLLVRPFFSLEQQAALLLVGALAGLLGALLSLRRETLRAEAPA